MVLYQDIVDFIIIVCVFYSTCIFKLIRIIGKPVMYRPVYFPFFYLVRLIQKIDLYPQ